MQCPSKFVVGSYCLSLTFLVVVAFIVQNYFVYPYRYACFYILFFISQPSRDELTPSDKLKSQSKGSLTSANSDEIGQFDVLDSGSLHRAHSSSELRGANGDQFADSGVHETRSLCEADGMTIRISPEKVLTLPSASLTAAQTKAITGQRGFMQDIHKSNSRGLP